MNHECQTPRRARRRTAGTLLWGAVAFTALVLVAGQVLMTSVYRLGVARTGVQESLPRDDREAFVIGIGRTPGGPSEWRHYAEALAVVQSAIAQPVEVHYAQSRSEASSMIASGSLDAAFVSTYRYLELEREHAGTLVVAPVLGGQSRDAAVLVTAADGPFDDLDSLRGRTVVLSAPESLGGHAYLFWLFDQRKADPREFFSEIVEGGTQDQNLGMVLKGRMDAASVNRSALTTWPPGSFHIVSQSPEYGMPPLVARRGVPQRRLDEIRGALLRFRPAAGEEAGALQGFTLAEETDYDFARVLLRYKESMMRTESGSSTTEGK